MTHLFEAALWNKRFLAWYVYDLANSVISVVFLLYFSQWVVIDRGFSDFSYSLPIILSTVVLMLISSQVGAWGDRTGRHHFVFALTSGGAALSTFLIVVAGRHLSGDEAVITSLLLFGCFQFFYQLALVPYYAFLKHLCGPSGYGRASGIGFTASQMGYFVGLGIGLPLVSGAVPWLGSDRLAPLTGAALLFLVLASIPMALLPRRVALSSDAPQNNYAWWRAFVEDLRYSRRFPGVFALLLSFYLFRDAMMSINVFGAIYLEHTFGVGDAVKSRMFAAAILGFAFGSWTTAAVSDRIGHKQVLVAGLLAAAFATMTGAFIESPRLILPVFCSLGIGMGASYSASRGYLASLIPAEQSGRFFGLYIFAERFASIVGPLVWASIVYLFSSSAPANYRYAFFSMGLLVLASLIPLALAFSQRQCGACSGRR